MTRYLSWLAVGIAAAFLVVASAAFSLPAVAALAFAISIGTLIVSAGIAVLDRRSLYGQLLSGPGRPTGGRSRCR